jgi:hypothetical protein
MSISNLQVSSQSPYDIKSNSCATQQAKAVVATGINDADFTEKVGCYSAEWTSAGPILAGSGLPLALVVPWTADELSDQHGVCATLVGPNPQELLTVTSISDVPEGSRVLCTIFSPSGSVDNPRIIRFCVC